MSADWLEVHRGERPLVVSLPHTGTRLPADVAPQFVSPWRARKDTDWRVDRLYDFAAGIGATTVRTRISRSVIDVNRDPSGASLYPGQATTELCPTTTFDGEPLYRRNQAPGAAEIARRRRSWFDPYHASLCAELARLRSAHSRVVLYEAHAIRSVVPKLFPGELPLFNLGTNGGAACDAALTGAVEAICDASGLSRVTDGRFKGGWTTRSYGDPAGGIHAIQMELACRGYLDEPPGPPTPRSWPPPYDPDRAASLRRTLTDVLNACLAFAEA